MKEGAAGPCCRELQDPVAGSCEAVPKEVEAALVGDTHLKPSFTGTLICEGVRICCHAVNLPTAQVARVF